MEAQSGGKNKPARLLVGNGGLARRLVPRPGLALTLGVAEVHGLAPSTPLEPKRRATR